ncbi:hypothetical protein GCM10009120_18840 [Sphingobacterium siyangense subsp. cladoniae]|uniref:sialate O-acetylesterase n=1 Tax=Sphingobacterium siyangense TaxID=459529 RepID=UPI0031F7F0F6
MAKSYKVTIFAGTKVVADMAQQVKNATIDASLELKPIAGGATEATAVLLPVPNPLPVNSNRKRTKAIGWYKNATGPAWEAPKDADNVNWWSYETGLWSLGSSVPMPKIDTSTLTPKTEFKALEGNLYGDNTIPVYLQARTNVSVNPDVIGAENAGYLLGMASSTTGSYYAPQNIPAGTYTCYVKVKFSNKGQINNLSYWRQTAMLGSIPADNFTLNQDYAFVFPLVFGSQLNAGQMMAQVRTRYPLSSTSPASLTIIDWKIYQGSYTKEQIEQSLLPIDKTKVQKSKHADNADYATTSGSSNTSTYATSAGTAETVENLPEKYVTKVESLADKIASKFVVDKVENYTDNSGATTIINYIDTEGLLHLGGSAPSTARLWNGFRFRPAGYATESKTYVVVLKGKVKGVSVRNLMYNRVSGPSNIVAQDLVDNVFSSFELAMEFTYSAGTANNTQNTYITYEAIAGASNVSYEAIFEVFAAFERIEGFALQDYLNAAKGDYEKFNEAMLPDSLASKDYVQEVFGGIQVSKYSQKDYQPDYDVSMKGAIGQSLELAGNAANATSDFANSITFSGSGTNINATTATANFIPVANAVTFTPVSASMVTVNQLLKKENNVDLSKFGNMYLIGAGGVSGGSITEMNKGTNAYNYFIAAVTRAKELCDVQGKTFGVPSIYWTQGEGDRAKTKQQYYDLLKQLFIDLNNDIKGITGQTKDVIFFTYQTSAWKGVLNTDGNYYQLGVQNAQVQLANDMPNVFLSTAMGQLKYNDPYHPEDRSDVGTNRAVAWKRVIIDGEDWPTFQPVSHQIVGNFLHLKFAAPVLPIRFDVSGDRWHNPNGKQPNFGFKVLKNGVDIISSEPFISKGNTVIIPCASSPLGSTVEYAVDGHYGGGNLCDSQNITIRLKNMDYKLDNFSVSFDDYLVN